MWYDPNRTLSYNKLFNFIISARNYGKTYGWTKKIIKDFLKDGTQFMYVRRYETEFEFVTNFFDAMIKNNEYPDCQFEVRGSTFYINEEVAGWAVPLSTSRKLKSTAFPFVKWIIFDEFIIQKSNQRYLTNEVPTFLDLFETVARERDNVRAILLSNAITVVNPYFLYFNVQPKQEKEFTTFKNNPDILIETPTDEEFTRMKKNTRFGKLIANTDYGGYSIGNQFMLDNNDFIQKRTPTARFYFSFVYNSEQFGVWKDTGAGKMFVCNALDPTNKLIYSFTLNDHTPNTMLLKQVNKSVLIKNFMDNFKLGNVYFENLKIKNVCYEVLKLTVL